MRTFHIGGVATKAFKDPQIIVRNKGTVRYRGLRMVHTKEGVSIVLNKTGSVQIVDDQGQELETYDIVVGSVLLVPDGGQVEKATKLAAWDPYNVPVLSEKAGTVVLPRDDPGRDDQARTRRFDRPHRDHGHRAQGGSESAPSRSTTAARTR